MPSQGDSQARLFASSRELLFSSSRDSSSEGLQELQAIAEVAEGSFQSLEESLEGAAQPETIHAECRRDLGGNLGGKHASPVEPQRPGGSRSRAEVASLAFARLKEATGVERAFLCGMLALPEASLPELPSRAFAGFVLVVQEPLDITPSAPPPSCPWCRSASTHLDIPPPPGYRRAGAAIARGDRARHGTAEIARAHPLGPRVRARAAGRAHAGLRHS